MILVSSRALSKQQTQKQMHARLSGYLLPNSLGFSSIAGTLAPEWLRHPGRHGSLQMQTAPQTLCFIFHPWSATPELADGMHVSGEPTSVPQHPCSVTGKDISVKLCFKVSTNSNPTSAQNNTDSASLSASIKACLHFHGFLSSYFIERCVFSFLPKRISQAADRWRKPLLVLQTNGWLWEFCPFALL